MIDSKDKLRLPTVDQEKEIKMSFVMPNFCVKSFVADKREADGELRHSYSAV